MPAARSVKKNVNIDPKSFGNDIPDDKNGRFFSQLVSLPPRLKIDLPPDGIT
jgi:hypothetical protein